MQTFDPGNTLSFMCCLKVTCLCCLKALCMFYSVPWPNSCLFHVGLNYEVSLTAGEETYRYNILIMLYCFICKFCSFKNPFAMIASLSELYFRFRKIYSVGTNEKRYFYELWQQHKLLKTMEMIEVWPDTYGERYIHQFQPEATHKIHQQ